VGACFLLQNGFSVKNLLLSVVLLVLCSTSVWAQVAFYRSRADFVGVDVLTLEVKYPGSRTELQPISVTVEAGSPGQGT
jgi:hypothetical protein